MVEQAASGSFKDAEAAVIAAPGSVAVVGLGCRFPGGIDGPDAYWRFLQNGSDAVGEVPATRWRMNDFYNPEPGHPGRAYSLHMAALDDIERFDAAFFGISPREAASIDPQQRLLLEVAWEALENAGLPPRRLAGSRTGVFIGIFSDDYAQSRLYDRPAEQIDGHTGLSVLRSLAAGRIAYHFDFHGPVLAVDTACSSSLLAIHMACRSIQTGECDLALAGGVNLVLSPEVTIGLSQMRALSASGRCRTFSAQADGYVRGEGCGIVILKKLSSALADGDTILAVIRGSAVNHDGRSNGLSAPNGQAQRAVIEAALANAGLAPDAIEYVEAHGTGTILGDPIEIQALGAALCRERRKPLIVGSVKTNFGHLEAAAGVAAFIKAVLAVRHGTIPPHLHCKELNPYIPWDRLSITVPNEAVPWTTSERVAGVSAFGMSGTNVHMLVGQAPGSTKPVNTARPHHLLALSARDSATLVRIARRYSAALKTNSSVDPASLCLTANAGRDHFNVRKALAFTSVPDLIRQLEQVAGGATVSAQPPSIAALFSDQDTLAPGMGQLLYETQPVFRNAILRCHAALSALDDRAADHPKDLLSSSSAGASSLFALQYAMFEMWRSWGITPSYVVGLGTGEFAAAYAAGVMDCETAIAMMAARREALRVRDADIARHSYIRALRPLALRTPVVPFISGCLGRGIGAEVRSPSYWAVQAFTAPNVAASFACLDDLSVGFALEIGPAMNGAPRTPVLKGLSQGADDWPAVLGALKALYEAGIAVDWHGVDGPHAHDRIALPTYSFADSRYFIDRPRRSHHSDTAKGFTAEPMALADSQDLRFQIRIGGKAHRFLQDHRVFGDPVFPAAAYCELIGRIGREVLKAPASIENLTFHKPLVLPESGDVIVQAIWSLDGSLKLFGRAADAGVAGPWTLHATCRLSRINASLKSETGIIRNGKRISGEDIYDALEANGLGYGPTFRALVTLEHSDSEAVGHVVLPSSVEESASDFDLHPSMLDACLICCSKVLPEPVAGRTWLPVKIDCVSIPESLGTDLICHARLIGEDRNDRYKVDLVLTDIPGRNLGTIAGVTFQLARQSALTPRTLSASAARQCTEAYHVTWRPMEALEATDTRTLWIVLPDRGGAGAEVAKRLAAQFEVRTAPSLSDGEFQSWLHETLSASAGVPRRIVDCRGLDIQGDPSEATTGCTNLLKLIQSMAILPSLANVRLDIVTRGSQRAAGSPVSPAGVVQAELWGLARVAAREYEELDTSLIDISPEPQPGETKELAELLISLPAGEACALREGQRFCARLAASSEQLKADESLQLPVSEDRSPGAGEVRIEVIASGLNFRDILHSLGMLPDSADAMPYGLECAGRVTAVGEGVSGLSVGMPVIAGLTVGSLGGQIVVPAEFVIPKPEKVSFREAATLPLAFITAHYALDRLAQLRPGQAVLIHAAAGGVGQAAIQVARRKGAEVFATASPGKWDLLRAQGVRHIFNSRTTDFAGEVLALTGGKGVDVVLNSLSGEFIPKSLSVLKDGGHFVDIGKIGAWTCEQVEALGRGLRYHRFDLWDVKRDRLLVSEMMRELVRRIEDGSLMPLPYVTFSINNAQAAFQHMARARHIGKIVIWQAPDGEEDLIVPDATYLITGGLGGLGLATASWLVSRGARHLALVSRRQADVSAKSIIESLERSGARILTVAADIADKDSATRLFTRLAAEMPPIRGIIHAAGVLDDGLLPHLTYQHFRRVLDPKVLGAWNLHRLSKDLQLDFFTLFASASGLFGNVGQGNYAAANAGLDALAHHRASLGLPALSIDWGPWADVGMAAGRLLADRGMGRIALADAEAALDRSLVEPMSQVAVIPVTWPEFLKSYRKVPPILRDWAPQAGAYTAAQAREEEQPRFRSRLEGAEPGERLALLRGHVRTLIAKTLDLSGAEAVDMEQELAAMGFDSLMSMELKAALEKSLGVTLRSTLTYDHPTAEAMVRHLYADALGWKEAAAPHPHETKQAAPTVHDPSDAEAALLDELNRLNY